MSANPEENRLAALPEGAVPIRVRAKDDLFNIHHELDLRRSIELLVARIPQMNAVLLFGSRRFRTGSVRSDVDLLILGDELPPASNVAAIAREVDSYLDVFIGSGGVAQSAVNESKIVEDNFGSLVRVLDAVELWRRDGGWIGDGVFATMRVLAGFNPPYTLAAMAGAEPLVKRVEIMFMSALVEEHAAIVSEFDRTIAAPSGTGASYQLGEIDDRQGIRTVAACIADRAGTVPAALTTFRGIELFRPKLVVLVGITAGIGGRLALGDFIIPDTVVEYEATKIGPEGEEPHGRQHAIDPKSIQSVKAWASLDRCLEEISVSLLRPVAGISRLSTDAMASGNKVVASAYRAGLIAKASRKTAAIEMESLGVVEACLRVDPPVPSLIVKAVSDLADENKDDSWHQFAASAAARLATALVREDVI